MWSCQRRRGRELDDSQRNCNRLENLIKVPRGWNMSTVSEFYALCIGRVTLCYLCSHTSCSCLAQIALFMKYNFKLYMQTYLRWIYRFQDNQVIAIVNPSTVHAFEANTRNVIENGTPWQTCVNNCMSDVSCSPHHCYRHVFWEEWQLDDGFEPKYEIFEQ